MELQKTVDVKKIKYLCGTSVGSLVSFALALNLRAEHLEEIIAKTRLSILMKIPSVAIWLPWNTLFKYGLVDIGIVRAVTMLFLSKAYPDKKNITFKEIDKDLIITAANLTKSYIVYFQSKRLLICLL